MGQVTQREKKRTSFRLADTEEGDLVMRPEDLRRPRPPPKTQLEGSPVSPFLLPIIRGLRFPHTSPGGRQKGCQRKNPRFRVRPCLHLLLVYNLRRAPGQGNLGSGLCWVEQRITYLAGAGPVGALGTVESPMFKLLMAVTQERGVDGPREQKLT